MRSASREGAFEALRRDTKVGLHAAKAETTRWKAGHARQKEEIQRLRTVAGSLRRSLLSADIIRELLPVRARTVAARAARAAAAQEETRLQQISPAYREAIHQAGHPHPHLTATDVQGLTWWVPAPPSLSAVARDRFVAEQKFPYRVMTQAREFAVGAVLLDIGANTGRMSIPRVLLGDFGRAFCAEPDPLNFTALVRNIASNGVRGLVLPDRVAIGAMTGRARLRQAKYPGGHHVLRSDAPETDAIDVECFTLDDWCSRLEIDPELVSYIKIDVQGWEAGVLTGATRLLACPHLAWQLEVHPASLDAAGSSAGELYQLCAQHFTHFVDLNKLATGPRARRTTDLPEALTYLTGRKRPTDIILFNASERLDQSMRREHRGR